MLKKQKTLYLGLARECSGGGSASQVALLSITTAPSGSFAVGSKYYNSSTKKIVTAVTADTWTGATSADPVLQTIYTYDGGYYIWDGDSLESTDLNLYEKVANKTDSPTETSPTKYPSSKALSDGLGSVVIPNASNTVKGINQIATDTEVVVGTDEVKTINAKQLKDRGAEFEITDFELKENVLSSTAKYVTKNSKFFIYSNGDVSADGKTILKSNTIVPNIINMVASENYLVVNRAEQPGLYVYSIGADGTLTQVRVYGDGYSLGYSTGKPASGRYKMSFENGIFCLAGDFQGVYGFAYLAEEDIVEGEITPNLVGTWDFQIGYVQGQWCLVYDDSGVKLKKAVNIADVLSATAISLGTAGNNILTLDDIDNKLVVLTSENYTTNRIVQVNLTTEAVSIDAISITGDLSYNTKLKKSNGKYYLINEPRGYWESTTIIGFTGTATGSGTDISVKETTAVIAQNSVDILWAGEVKIPILKSEVTDLVTTAITIAKVAKNTVYKYGTIDSLTIAAVEVSNRKSIIYFSTSASFTTFTAPTGQAFVGSSSVVAKKNYKIEIENGIMEVKEYAVPS